MIPMGKTLKCFLLAVVSCFLLAVTPAKADVDDKLLGQLLSELDEMLRDGMPISGGLDNINPADIQSIEVLKDTASGAVS